MDESQEVNARIECLRRACDLQLQNATKEGRAAATAAATAAEVVLAAEAFFEFLSASATSR